MVALDMTPAHAIQQLERTLGLPDSALAHALGATPRTLERWRTGATYPRREARQRLAALIALDRRLRETFDSPGAIRAWLRASNRFLGGLTPAEAAQAGRVDRVDATLEALDSGIFV